MTASTWRTTAELLRTQRISLASFWLIIVVVFGTIAVISSFVADDMTTSVWIGGARWAPQYYAAVLGILNTALSLRVHVAHGVTRRRFSWAGIVFGVIVCLGFAVISEAGFGLERILYDAKGWEQFGETPDVLAGPGVIIASTLSFAILYSVYYFSGWAIASAFYRLGALRGVLLIIPLVAPEFLMEAVSWRALPVPFLDIAGDREPVTGGELLFGLALAVALAGVVVALLRSTSLGAKATS